MMIFESLPNDLLLYCFEYLNAPDMFYAFEQLNSRFYRLIRTIPLSLNFEDVHKSIFDRFCQKMLDDPEIQQQVYSLKLSNEQTPIQIQAFCTYFSLAEFTRLRSLALIEVKQNNVEQLSAILPSLSQLTRLQLIPSLMVMDALLDKLPKCRQIIPLTKLSVKFGRLNQFYRLLLHMPLLRCLTISNGFQYESVSPVEIDLLQGHVNHLTHLVVSNCMFDTDNLIHTIAQMVSLRNLTVSVYDNSDIINASRWQQLITSSLPHLSVFRFKFGTFDRNEIMRKYDDFQSDFWIKEHRWFTECLLGDGIASYIFTVPYLSDTRAMWLKCVRYSNRLINTSRTFDNVTHLHAPSEQLMRSKDFFFPNITILVMDSLPVLVHANDEQRFIKSLKTTMELSNLKHLEFPFCCRMNDPRILLEILKEAPKLSSLNIHNCALYILKTNKEICRYASKMIKKLQLGIHSQSNPCNQPRDVNAIPRVFPNTEHLICPMIQPDSCLFLLNKLPRLSKLSTVFYQSRNDDSFDKVKEKLSKLKNILFYEEVLREHQHAKMMEFALWVDRDGA